MKHIIPLLFSLSLLASCTEQNPAANTTQQKENAPNPTDSLRQHLTSYLQSKKATVGIAFKHLEDGDTFSINGQEHFAMMSVAKFPQALALLRMVDQGKLSIDQSLHFTKDDLKQFTGSSILKDHPQSSFDLSMTEALRYSIGQSDNITSNKIFEIEGGPQAVEEYVHGLGIADIGVATDYAHMRPDSYRKNWSTPVAMVQLLDKFYRDRILSTSSRSLLWKLMVESTSGPNRLKGGVPDSTVVAHKTGTSGTDSTGVTPAFNDVGIVQLPGGTHYAIAVFVSDSKEDGDTNAAIIAYVNKEVWNYFLQRDNK